MKGDCHAARALKLLPCTVRENLPALGSQQSRGGQAKAIVRCLASDGSRTWYVTEGSARRDPDGKAVDYLLYGLVEGERRTLEYFWLSDLAAFCGSSGAPLQRDSHWRPKSLVEIAPELFQANHRKVED